MTSRVSVWDTASKSKVCDFKILSNEAYLAFSADSQSVLVKNTAGQIAIADATTGRPGFATTDPSRREGGRPVFEPDSAHAVDGDWSGVLRKTNASTGQTTDVHHFGDGYMFRDASWPVGSTLGAFALGAKHRTRGGDRLLLYASGQALSEPRELAPPNDLCSIDGGWRGIESIALHPSGDLLALSLEGRSPKEDGCIVLVGIDGTEVANARLPTRMHSVRGMAWSSAGILCASVHEIGAANIEGQWSDELAKQIKDHIYVYRDSNMSLIDRWPWLRASTLQFSTDGKLAVSGEPFACISDISLGTVA